MDLMLHSHEGIRFHIRTHLLLISLVPELERIMARCGLQSPHLVSPHCFIAVGILNIINI